MAKRYTKEEKRRIVSEYMVSGQHRSAFAEVYGISSVTLKSWQAQYGSSDLPGFWAISKPTGSNESPFKIQIGEVTLEFGSLPPASWIRELLAALPR
ncbi:MAG: transposase [Chitinophagales bacterium]|jgi:transposase-like protein